MELSLAYLIVGGILACGWGLVRALHAASEGRNPSIAVAICLVGVLCFVFVWFGTDIVLTWKTPTEAFITIWVSWMR